ncbi:MAG: hypothetical protein N2380_04920 [bacterium]|nr:hypothetical protein [bacterium]
MCSKNSSVGHIDIWVIILIVALFTMGIISFLYLQGYILDREPPKVSIISPSKSKEIILSAKSPKAKEVIKIEARDNKFLDRVTLLLNDSEVKSSNKNNKFSFEWEIRTEGKYIFKAIAYDRAKNKGESKVITITVKVQGILPPNYIGFQKPISTYVNASNVFLREGPSINYKTIKILKYREKVLVFGKWISKDSNEAITIDRVTLVTLDGESIALDRGKALLIIRKEDHYYIASVQIENRKITGKIPVHAVKSISDRPWCYIRTKKGDEGWIFGEFLENIGESSR